MASYVPTLTELFTGIPKLSGTELDPIKKEAKDPLDKQITETKGGTKISDKDKNMPEAQRSMLEQGIRGLGDSLSQAERDAFYNSFLKEKVFDAQRKEQERIDNLSFTGRMLETLKTDANARQKFFDQIGSIGAEISRPIEPGEARSLLRDVIVGSERGEKKSLTKAATGANIAAKMAQVAKDSNPLQFFTTTMKEIYDEAARTHRPGSPEYNEFIRSRLRIANIGSGAKALFESLENERAQLNTAAAVRDPEIKKQIQNNIDIINQQIRELLGMADTASNTLSIGSIYDGTGQNN